jgi:ABC-type dipeptide/oligopeptide/nickel transport system permease subunit
MNENPASSALDGFQPIQPRNKPFPARLVRGFFRFTQKKPLGTLGLTIVLILILVALFAPFIATAQPNDISGAARLKAPGAAHFFGTDDLGRDVFSRVVYGSRISIQVGVIAVGISTIIGALVGLLSGYLGGAVDMIFQRIVDALMAMPLLIFALAIVSALGPSIINVMLAVGLALAPGLSRVVRGSVITVREHLFIEAARSMGATDIRIVLRHVLPNVMAPIVVLATAGLGGAILAEGALSFLGVGTPPPAPSWGGMLSGSSRTYMETAPWLAIFPGLALTLTVLGFNILGDALQDYFDPRLRDR